jgi:hypothetical protein
MVIGDFRTSWENDSSYKTGRQPEYGALEALWKVFHYHDVSIDRYSFNAITGYPSIYAYHKDMFWLYDVFREQIIDNALKRCGFEVNRIIPNSFEEALLFVKDSLFLAKPVYVSWYEPFVIYGYDGDLKAAHIHWQSDSLALNGRTDSRKWFEKNWWNYSDKDSDRMMMVIKKKISDLSIVKKIFLDILD